MSRANEKLPIITAVEYFGKQERNESYKGYVVYPDGVVTMVLSEVVIKSQPLQIDVDEYYNMSLNKYTHYHLQTNIKYHEGMTPYVCEASSTRVHIQDYTLQVESTTKTEMVKRQVKEDLLRGMTYFYQDREFNKIKQDSFLHYTINHPSEIQIDVFAPRTQAQHDFAKLKQKIDDGTIKKRDFTSDLQYLLGKQIETYFACFDPKDPSYTKFWDTYHKGQATGFEAYIPVWSCVRNSVDAFQRAEAGDGINYYFDGIGYFSLALADVITIGMTTEVMMGAKAVSYGMLNTVPEGVVYLEKEGYRLKPLRSSGGELSGFTISRGKGYGSKPRFDFERIYGPSKQERRLTIPKFLRDKPLPHWHRQKGNNLRYHRPWEIGPDGKRRW